MHFRKKALAPLIFLAVLSVLFGAAGVATAAPMEDNACEAESVVDVAVENVKEADNAQSDIDQARMIMKGEETSNPELVNKFIQGEGLLLPEFATGETDSGIQRQAYGVAIDNEFLVVTVDKDPDAPDKVLEASLSIVAEGDDGGFKVDSLADSHESIAEASPQAIGNCPVGKTWHCTQHAGGGCFERNCARCTYLLHWKAIVLCAFVACPYVANYTCCTSGQCVPRMIG